VKAGGKQRAFTLVSCSANSSTLKMEAIRSSETSVDFQQTTRRYIPEDSTLLDDWFSIPSKKRDSFFCQSITLIHVCRENIIFRINLSNIGSFWPTQSKFRRPASGIIKIILWNKTFSNCCPKSSASKLIRVDFQRFKRITILSKSTKFGGPVDYKN
jgi:hypothetical protein